MCRAIVNLIPWFFIVILINFTKRMRTNINLRPFWSLLVYNYLTKSMTNYPKFCFWMRIKKTINSRFSSYIFPEYVVQITHKLQIIELVSLFQKSVVPSLSPRGPTKPRPVITILSLLPLSPPTNFLTSEILLRARWISRKFLHHPQEIFHFREEKSRYKWRNRVSQMAKKTVESRCNSE